MGGCGWPGPSLLRPDEQNADLPHLRVGRAWRASLIFTRQVHELPTKLVTGGFLFPPKTPVGAPL